MKHTAHWTSKYCLQWRVNIQQNDGEYEFLILITHFMVWIVLLIMEMAHQLPISQQRSPSHIVWICPNWLNTYCWLRMSSSQKSRYQLAAKFMQVAAPITPLCLVYVLSIMLIVERGEKITHYKHCVYLYDWLHNNSVTTFQSISRLFKVNSLRWLMSRYPQPSFPELVRLSKFSANDNHI